MLLSKIRKNRFSDKKEAMSADRQGFTLVELLLAMAIISILSGAILVSISSQRRRAHESRMTAELSATISPMLLCRTDDGEILEPAGAGGGNICGLGAEYGTWPDIDGTDFGNYASADGDFNDGAWHFYLDDGTARICCNSGSSRCHSLATGAACTNDAP